jgi:sterol desaturase/sphingolipid hydroxylase (fatty acid hydroxylase superfamily)
MFRVDFIERYFSRVRPWQVLVLWVPVVLFLAVRAALDPALSAAEDLGLGLGGVAAWTLLEYLLHRFLFHFQPSKGSVLATDLWYLLHEVHHEYPYDRDRLVMPPLVSVLLAVLLAIPARLLAGPHAFDPFFAGLVAGYIWYDLTHYATHHLKPRTSWGRRRKAHHLLHHFKDPGTRFGVTTPLWDFVFGTLGTSAGAGSSPPTPSPRKRRGGQGVRITDWPPPARRPGG